MCDAYENIGVIVNLFISNNVEKSISNDLDYKDFYLIENDFKIIFIPVNYLSRIRKFFSLAVLFPIKSILKNPDLVHSRTLLSAYVLAKYLKKEVIFELHDAIWENKTSRKIFLKLVKCENCKFLIVITKALEEETKKIIKIKKPILVAPDGVSQKKLKNNISKEEARKKLGLSIGKFTILYSGHLYKGRGIELIIELARRLPDFHFLLVGGNPKEIDYYTVKVSNLKNIQFLGFKNQFELQYYLKSADVLLMPYENKIQVAGTNSSDTSKYASPLKMFEYMASGNPIVSSTLPVLSEVLKHQQNALMVPYDDVEGWVAALKLLKDYPSFANEIANKAKEDVKEYTWEKRAEKIINFYKSCHDKK